MTGMYALRSVAGAAPGAAGRLAAARLRLRLRRDPHRQRVRAAHLLGRCSCSCSVRLDRLGRRAGERVALKALIIDDASRSFLMVMGLMMYLLLGGSPLLGHPVRIAATPEAGLVAFVLIFWAPAPRRGCSRSTPGSPRRPRPCRPRASPRCRLRLEKILGISFLITVTNQMFILDRRARVIMVIFGLITVFAVLLPALVERNFKEKTLALATISPVGFMVAGTPATSHVAGIAGALMYMLTHATYKSGMFFAAGALEAKAGSARARGHARARPGGPGGRLGFGLAYLAAISMVPTGGFMARS